MIDILITYQRCFHLQDKACIQLYIECGELNKNLSTQHAVFPGQQHTAANELAMCQVVAPVAAVHAVHHQAGRAHEHVVEVEGVLLPGPVEGLIAHQANDDLGRYMTTQQSIQSAVLTPTTRVKWQMIAWGSEWSGLSPDTAVLREPPWLCVPPRWPSRCASCI